MTEEERLRRKQIKDERALILTLRQMVWQGVAQVYLQDGRPVFRTRSGQISEETLRKIRTNQELVDAAFSQGRHQAVTKARGVILGLSSLYTGESRHPILSKLHALYEGLIYAPQGRAELIKLAEGIASLSKGQITTQQLLTIIDPAIREDPSE